LPPASIAATMAAVVGSIRTRWSVVAALSIASLLLLSPAASSSSARSLAAYSGIGSWVSIYDTQAWQNPERVVRTLKAHHVHTLFLETANDRQKLDVVRPAVMGRFIRAAHAARLAVVGWYLPSLTTPRRDLRRALAGARFRSSGGERFDAFALDIEATDVHRLDLRSDRAVRLVTSVRRALPRAMALGAITIDPVGGRYWSGYPFARLAPNVDVFLPMEYFTSRTSGAARVDRYSAANVREIRRRVGLSTFPVHPIGGESRHASLRELRAFLRSSAASHSVGVSLWEYGETSPRQWATLAREARASVEE
jgi:hypothetical protein